MHRTINSSPHTPSHGAAGKTPCVHISIASPALRAHLHLYFLNALRARPRALLLPLCPEAGNHGKRCGYAPCARAGTTYKRPFVSTASTTPRLHPKHDGRCSACTPLLSEAASIEEAGENTTKALALRAKAGVRTSTAGKSPACDLNAAGKSPARVKNTFKVRSRLSELSPEKKLGKGQERQRGKRGHDLRAPPTHSLRPPPPLPQGARGHDDRPHPRQHARFASWRCRRRDGPRGGGYACAQRRR